MVDWIANLVQKTKLGVWLKQKARQEVQEKSPLTYGV